MNNKNDKNLDDLGILFANEGFIEIAGERIKIREIPISVSLPNEKIIQPIIDSLSEVIENSKEETAIPRKEWEKIIIKHYDNIFKLIAMTIEKPYEWAINLNDKDGYSLLNAFMTVNKAFFLNRVAQWAVEKLLDLEPDLEKAESLSGISSSS